MQARTEKAATGQRPRLESVHEFITVTHLDAGAVVVRDGIEGAVEVAAAQGDNGFEPVPCSADVLEPIRNADELNRDLVAFDLVESGHAPF